MTKADTLMINKVVSENINDFQSCNFKEDLRELNINNNEHKILFIPNKETLSIKVGCSLYNDIKLCNICQKIEAILERAIQNEE